MLVTITKHLGLHQIYAARTRPMPSCGVRPSVFPYVCPSCTFVYSVKTSM